MRGEIESGLAAEVMALSQELKDSQEALVSATDYIVQLQKQSAQAQQECEEKMKQQQQEFEEKMKQQQQEFAKVTKSPHRDVAKLEINMMTMDRM